MLFMNEYDIADATQRYRGVKNKAARILRDHVDAINSGSDGWAHWSAGPKSAKRLMELIQSVREPTEADLRKALAPMKALYTKHPSLIRPESLK